MKKIDYIYKNFDVIAFSKNLNKIKNIECSELNFDFLTKIVLDLALEIFHKLKKKLTITSLRNQNQIAK